MGVIPLPAAIIPTFLKYFCSISFVSRFLYNKESFKILLGMKVTLPDHKLRVAFVGDVPADTGDAHCASFPYLVDVLSEKTALGELKVPQVNLD